MTTDIAVSFAILGAAVGLFIWNRLPVGVVALGVALSLWATGVLDLGKAFAGFGDPTILFIASLFVVSEALDATGITAWVGQKLVSQASSGRGRLLVLMMLLAAGLSALVTPNGATAALIPMVMVLAVRLDWAPSKLLIPMAFAAHAGSMLVLTGSPVSVLVSEAAAGAGGRPFNFFEFGLAGVPLLVGTVVVMLLLGDRLLPKRTPETIPPDLSSHALTLVEEYALTEGSYHLRIRPTSPLAGTLRANLDLADRPGLALLPAEDAASRYARETLEPGDEIVVRGDGEHVAAFASDLHLGIREAEHDEVRGMLFSRASGLAEVVVPPRSTLIGRTMFPGMITGDGELVVLAIRRRDHELGPKAATLQAGDIILLQGTWDALDDRLADADVLVVDSPDLVRRQAIPLGPGAKKTLLILGLMVLAMASGLLPAAVAGVIAAIAVVLAGVLSVDQAYRSISWTTIVLLGGMMPLSVALTETGAAQLVAGRLIDVVGPWGPYGLLAGLFLIVAILGQLISNMATALVVIPVALAAALDLGISVQTVMMSVAVAASAAYMTPIATPANMMIMGPGGYRFSDYWKIGLVLLGVTFLVAVVLVPIIWPF